MAEAADAPVVLISGASRGIGRYLVERSLERGRYVVGCSRGPSDLKPSERYLHVELDIAEEKGVLELFRTIRSRFGRLDGLINNAGIASMNHALLTPTETFQRLLATNLVGPFLLSREAVKVMRSRRYGRIVNFSTVAVPLRLAGELAYAASKSAIVTVTQILAKEIAELGITVNAVGPTPVDTDLIRKVPPEKIQKILDQQAIHRLGTFADVDNVVEFFMRPESEFVTGQVVYLGGVPA